VKNLHDHHQGHAHPANRHHRRVAPHHRRSGNQGRTLPGPWGHSTLTRNDLQYGTNGPVIPTLAEPTPVQRRAFQLIGAPIPTTLT
jgi:hypothetical protein